MTYIAPLSLEIYSLHPSSCPVVPAEKTLCGTADKEGLKFCHPYSTANETGWWLYPPSDIDISWDGETFQYEEITPYSNTDHHLVKSLIRDSDGVNIDKFCPESGGRTKYSFGDVAPNVFQIWTGCIFKTPPGWGTHIRSPINFTPKPFYIMEGVIQTHWLHYDIWLNLVFTQKKLVQLRREQLFPLAQIIPVKLEEKWGIKTETINRNTEESNQIFDYWLQYNHKKYGTSTTSSKDPTTYYKEKKKILEKGLPKPKSRPTKAIKKLFKKP